MITSTDELAQFILKLKGERQAIEQEILTRLETGLVDLKGSYLELIHIPVVDGASDDAIDFDDVFSGYDRDVVEEPQDSFVEVTGAGLAIREFNSKVRELIELSREYQRYIRECQSLLKNYLTDGHLPAVDDTAPEPEPISPNPAPWKGLFIDPPKPPPTHSNVNGPEHPLTGGDGVIFAEPWQATLFAAKRLADPDDLENKPLDPEAWDRFLEGAYDWYSRMNPLEYDSYENYQHELVNPTFKNPLYERDGRSHQPGTYTSDMYDPSEPGVLEWHADLQRRKMAMESKPREPYRGLVQKLKQLAKARSPLFAVKSVFGIDLIQSHSPNACVFGPIEFTLVLTKSGFLKDLEGNPVKEKDLAKVQRPPASTYVPTKRFEHTYVEPAPYPKANPMPPFPPRLGEYNEFIGLWLVDTTIQTESNDNGKFFKVTKFFESIEGIRTRRIQVYQGTQLLDDYRMPQWGWPGEPQDDDFPLRIGG